MTDRKRLVVNFFVGFFSQFVVLVLGLVVPRIIITNYNSDANGLIGTVTQIFTYMALLEAGVAQAARNALFKPLKDDDHQKISKIISTANRYYTRISIIYAAAVIVLAAILPLILKTGISYWQVFIITLIEGSSSVISFFFLQKWITFLSAKGKNYITNSLASGGKIIAYGAKITLALLSVNVCFVQIGYLIGTVLQVIFYQIYIKKHYPWVKCNEDTKGYKLEDRNYYVITEVAWTIFSSTDMIVLSICISTSLASVYFVYNMVFVALNTLLTAVYNSVSYKLGKDYAEDIEKYKKTHDSFNSFFMSTITILMCVTYWLIIPFVKIYTSGVEDINYVREWLPLLFCAIQMMTFSRYIAGNLSGLSGYAKQTSIVSLIEAIINISLSFILVHYFDIVGVLIATAIALPLKVVYTNWLAEKKVLKRKPWKTLLIIFTNYSIFAVTVVLKEFVFNINVTDYFNFALFGFLLTAIYALAVFIINAIINKQLLLFFKPTKK